ncbi:MAG TPA: glycoside hydrolase family 32 protein [Verrucomicrobiae bacterium]|nr:glycoside hydrolase family 32 protein [Verrucomicrobiae bacterium]
MFQTRHVALLAVALSPLYSHGETASNALVRATAAVEAAAPRAQADSTRPIFHITAPSQWINDPNGPIFYQGFYHLFYQLHPFSDASGPKYWGHVRSRDLAKWEHLPIALAPSGEAGETEVWSGCCTLNGLGQPMIFYTSIGPDKPAFDHADQWAAIGTDDLVHWQKSPANPALSDATNDGTKIYDWRDPFVFHDGNKTFLVLGGSLNESKGGQAVVNIYEAENAGLTKWKYRGVLFQLPDADARTSECPNFFKLGDEWVLFVSPYGKVQYFVGDFDATTCRFHPRTRGVLDYGPNFYAPNTMLVPDGRRLVWGWVNGFPGGRGWNGCLSVPRLLSFSRDGQLRQNPAPQLEKLRGKETGWNNVILDSTAATFPLPATNTLEIAMEIDLQTASRVSFSIPNGGNNSQVTLSYDGLELQVMDVKAPLTLPKGDRKLKLRIFLDRSVLEVFANETVCVTKTIAPLEPGVSLAIRAEGGQARAKQIQAWPMKTIW